MLEPLEPRRHFNAAIHVTITKAAITVRGTDAADFLQIVGTTDPLYGEEPDGGYSLRSDAGTPLVVNGKTLGRPGHYESLLVVAGSPLWYKPLRIDLGAGDDAIASNGFPGVYSATFKLGPGDDKLQVEQASRFLNVDAGDGNDTIGIRMSVDVSAQNVAIFPGLGRDRVAIDATVYYDNDGITGKLLIDDSGGATSVALTGLRVKRETFIRTHGRSNDFIALSGCRFLRPLTILTGNGVDTIAADTATTFKQEPSVLAEGGDDDVRGF